MIVNCVFLFQTYTITDTVQKIAESYDCKPIEGMLSHQLEQNHIDGEKTIIQARNLNIFNSDHFANLNVTRDNTWNRYSEPIGGAEEGARQVRL